MTAQLEALRLQLMASEIAVRIGERLRARREELGLNQRELADRMPAAVSNQHVSNWERGVYKPSERYLEKLAEALDVDVSYFYARDDEPRETPDLMGAFSGDGDGVEERLESIETGQQAIVAQLDALSKAVEALANLATTADQMTPQPPTGRKRPKPR
jgi:transcriptional regulator with XRE-family HTH domain